MLASNRQGKPKQNVELIRKLMKEMGIPQSKTPVPGNNNNNNPHIEPKHMHESSTFYESTHGLPAPPTNHSSDSKLLQQLRRRQTVIEKQYKKSVVNKIYIFPRAEQRIEDIVSLSSHSSIDEMDDITVYTLREQNRSKMVNQYMLREDEADYETQDEAADRKSTAKFNNKILKYQFQGKIQRSANPSNYVSVSKKVNNSSDSNLLKEDRRKKLTGTVGAIGSAAWNGSSVNNKKSDTKKGRCNTQNEKYIDELQQMSLNKYELSEKQQYLQEKYGLIKNKNSAARMSWKRKKEPAAGNISSNTKKADTVSSARSILQHAERREEKMAKQPNASMRSNNSLSRETYQQLLKNLHRTSKVNSSSKNKDTESKQQQQNYSVIYSHRYRLNSSSTKKNNINNLSASNINNLPRKDSYNKYQETGHNQRSSTNVRENSRDHMSVSQLFDKGLRPNRIKTQY